MTLQAYLKLAGKTEAAFAREIGVYQSSVWRWVRGERTPNPQTLRRISVATEGAVTANDFILETELRSPGQRVA